MAQQLDLVRGDQLGRGDRVQGFQRRGVVQGRDLVRVPQLQQLHGPFDVGQSPAAQLGVRVGVGAARQPLGLDAGFDAANLPHHLGGHAVGRIARLVGHQQEPLTQVRVAGNRVRAQQRLDLPRLRPLLVVGGVGTQRADQRTAAALGPQVGVDFQRRVDAGRAQQRSNLLGDRRRPLHRPRILDAGGRLADEHHVGVGPVAQLGAAQPAHADDRDGRRRLAVLGEVGADHRVQSGLQHGHPHRGERPAHVGDLEHAEQVGGADAGQFAAAQRAGGGDGPHRVGMAAGRGDQRPGHHGGLGLEQFRARPDRRRNPE